MFFANSATPKKAVPITERHLEYDETEDPENPEEVLQANKLSQGDNPRIATLREWEPIFAKRDEKKSR